MLSPLDEYPIHQTALPLAQAGGGHPDFYDRFWFNGFREDLFFALALGVYPNRDVIDAAFSVVRNGTQRSVFASRRLALDRRILQVGPIKVEIVDPFLVNRIIVDAPSFGLEAELTMRARTAALEEDRQTRFDGTRLAMDVTRATQFCIWSGGLTVDGEDVDVGSPDMLGVKDRSWGIRRVGKPAPSAPSLSVPQAFFLWTPLHFSDCVLHGLVFENRDGTRWSETMAQLPVIGPGDPTWGPDVAVEHFSSFGHRLRWAEGLRRSQSASVWFGRSTGVVETVELTPILTFRMKGAGYGHPEWGHGTWIGEAVVGGEATPVDDLDNLEPSNIHVQQVVKATWGDRRGIGVIEQAVLGPHDASGFVGLLDGASAGATSS